jgi:4-hydroxybenzoyl-CoA reductase beta subunit
MKLPYFEYLEPKTLDQVLQSLSEHPGQTRLLAGGTDLLPLMRFGLAQPTHVMSLRSLSALHGVTVRNGELRIGSMTTLTELLSSNDVKESFAALYEALESVAAPPIRNAATIGGNLCQNSRCLFYNQSKTWREEQPPCFKAGGDVCLAVPGGKKCFSVYQGDLAPALIAFGTSITVEKKGSSRTIPLEKLFSGEAKQPIALSDDEVITEVLLPVPKGQAGSAYRKMRMRSAVDYPLISVAAVLSLDGRGTINGARLVLGAAGPAPSVAQEAGAMLLGKDPKDADLDSVGQAVARGTQMVNNLELPASYRRKMIPVFARRAIEATIRTALGKERS